MEGLKIGRYQVVLEAFDRVELPEYAGSTLRGGFGGVFRKVTCSQPEGDCATCLLRDNCPYSLIFDSSPPEGSEALRKYSDIPRPFVLEPPEKGAMILTPGDRFSFGLVLVGRALAYLPYFILMFQELGRTGLGRGRGRFRVVQVWEESPVATGLLYDGQPGPVIGSARLWTWQDAENFASQLQAGTSAGKLRLIFCTPLRLVYEARLVARPELHFLVRSLLRRISSLSHFHCAFTPQADFRRLIELAAEAKLLRDATRWRDWERYSSRQDCRLKLGGLVGEAEYENVPAELLPWLYLGTWLHVGKASTFGLGRYEVLPVVKAEAGATDLTTSAKGANPNLSGSGIANEA